MPTDPTPLDHAALREAAERATPGEWELWPARYPGIEAPGHSIVVYGRNGEECGVRGTPDRARTDAAYIVAAQPRVMLALLDDVAAKDARIREAEEILQQFVKAYDGMEDGDGEPCGILEAARRFIAGGPRP